MSGTQRGAVSQGLAGRVGSSCRQARHGTRIQTQAGGAGGLARGGIVTSAARPPSPATPSSPQVYQPQGTGARRHQRRRAGAPRRLHDGYVGSSTARRQLFGSAAPPHRQHRPCRRCGAGAAAAALPAAPFVVLSAPPPQGTAAPFVVLSAPPPQGAAACSALRLCRRSGVGAQVLPPAALAAHAVTCSRRARGCRGLVSLRGRGGSVEGTPTCCCGRAAQRVGRQQSSRLGRVGGGLHGCHVGPLRMPLLLLLLPLPSPLPPAHSALSSYNMLLLLQRSPAA